MKLASQELQFELAAILRDEVIKLKKMQKEREEMVSHKNEHGPKKAVEDLTFPLK
jgi:excinuclease UvrABC nuclease subunit